MNESIQYVPKTSQKPMHLFPICYSSMTFCIKLTGKEQLEISYITQHIHASKSYTFNICIPPWNLQAEITLHFESRVFKSRNSQHYWGTYLFWLHAFSRPSTLNNIMLNGIWQSDVFIFDVNTLFKEETRVCL